MIIRKRFKLFKKLTKRDDLPFKTLEYKTELFKFTKLNSVSILKEKQKLLLAGDTIQSLDLHKNTPIHIKTFQFNEGQLNVCVNNKGKEIIIEYFLNISMYFLKLLSYQKIRYRE